MSVWLLKPTFFFFGKRKENLRNFKNGEGRDSAEPIVSRWVRDFSLFFLLFVFVFFFMLLFIFFTLFFFQDLRFYNRFGRFLALCSPRPRYLCMYLYIAHCTLHMYMYCTCPNTLFKANWCPLHTLLADITRDIYATS